MWSVLEILGTLEAEDIMSNLPGYVCAALLVAAFLLHYGRRNRYPWLVGKITFSGPDAASDDAHKAHISQLLDKPLNASA